jgi:hypothetical protein
VGEEREEEEGQQHIAYVFSAYVPIPYVTTHLGTRAQLEHVVTAQSTINHDGSYVVPETIGIDSLYLTPAKQGLLPSLKRKYELLHFGYVTQWETFAVLFIHTKYYAMMIRQHQDNFSCALGFRLSTLVLLGCLSVAT